MAAAHLPGRLGQGATTRRSRALHTAVAASVVLGLASMTLVATTAAADPTGDPGAIRVPQDAATLEAAIEASQPGTLILLDRGTYPGGVLVPDDRPGITIRGVDRNEVVLDGEGQRPHGIEIRADGVTVENLSAHDFELNGIYWEDVDGFAGRYLSVWNVGLYGIYAIESSGGIFEQSLVSGAADAAFYVGECNPCDTIVTDVVARYSAVGYSGTNAGGNLEIRDSLWEFNGSGIMPNSYEGQPAPPPQRDSRIVGNTIRGSGSVPVPANSPLAGYVGVGIAIAGGWENAIEENEISDSAAYGIALYPSIQRDGSPIVPTGNVVRANRVRGSGAADLAVAAGSAAGNCFADNDFETSRPAAIETVLPCEGEASTTGDAAVLADLGIPVPEALERLGERPGYRTMPAPSPEPTMPPELVSQPDPAPPAGDPMPPVPYLAAGLVILGAAIVIGLIVWLVWRRRAASPR